MARLDRLEGDREVAQLAATLGREFSYERLAAVATLDEPTLQAEVAKLVHAEILYQKGRLPRCSYIFKHALLEDALYNALVKGKRQPFHRRIAEVLEARFPQTADTQPELLAHHFTEAGLTERAIGYWLKAGLRSRERSAEIEAISHLTRGQALLKTLNDSPERDARELELLTPLGTAYIASRGYAAPEVGPVFRRARELCERDGQPSQLFALMLGTWEWHTVRGDLQLCMDLAAEGMEFASRLNDPGLLMEALFMSGETMLYRGDFAAGARLLRDGGGTVRRPGTHQVLGCPHRSQRRRHPPQQPGSVPLAPGIPGPSVGGQPRDASTRPRDRPPIQPGLRPAPHGLAVPLLPDRGRGPARPPSKRSRSRLSRGSPCGRPRVRFSRVPECSCKVILRKRCRCC